MDLRPSWERRHPAVVRLRGGEALEVAFVQSDLGGVPQITVLASTGFEVVAAARLIALPGDAEIEFVVEDAHQRRGIGTALRDTLVRIARERGIYRLHARVAPENVAIRRLLAAPTLELLFDRGDVLELVVAETTQS
jgi:GNAT superfamily N-acetyltransferase